MTQGADLAPTAAVWLNRHRGVMQALRRALVVEDHPDARALVRTYLLGMGMEVVDVAEGRSAIRHLESSPPDLVCLDLMLPELSGFEVCEFMRAHPSLRNVPILIMSARAKPMDRAFAEQVGATAYLVKPFKRSEFGRAVEACMSHIQPTEEHQR